MKSRPGLRFLVSCGSRSAILCQPRHCCPQVSAFKGQPCFQGCWRCGEKEEVSEHFRSLDPRRIHPTDTEHKACLVRSDMAGAEVAEQRRALPAAEHLHQPPGCYWVISILYFLQSQDWSNSVGLTGTGTHHVLHSTTRKCNPGACGFGGATFSRD